MKRKPATDSERALGQLAAQMGKPKRRRGLNDRDHALVSEVIGFLRGIASGYNSDDHQYLWAEPLSVRLKDLRERVWPVDG